MNLKLFSKKLKKYYIIFGLILILIFLSLPIFISLDNEVYLNQFSLQKNWIEQGSFSDIPNFLRSAYPFGLKLFFNKENYKLNNVSNYGGVLEYLFYNIPEKSYVFPTETYYYYRFPFEDKVYAGNIRLLDALEGKLHLGYYDVKDPHGQIYYHVFDKNDGVSINLINDGEYNVEYKGVKRTFYLTQIYDKAPKKLSLLSEEEFVAHIIDESGTILFLLYNNKTSSFYYVLDEERFSLNGFYSIQNNYLVDKETKFIFYNDKSYNRKILVGVSKDNIYQNNYYDGPFDQVPPRLQLKSKLEAAYPYVKYGGGIDEYGNFYSFEGSRVAISPYLDYENVSDLILYLNRCNENDELSIYWSCLTYEWKKDFHKTLEAYQNSSVNSTYIHMVFSSQGWPTNHEANVSLQWPSEHSSNLSRSWVANHISFTSINN